MNTNLSLFNNNMSLFLIDLIELFPTNSKLQEAKKNQDIIIMMDSEYTIKMFKNNLYMYKKDIIEHNEKIIKKNTFLNTMNISVLWDSLNNENREICWKYLECFVVLCNKYYDNI